MDFEINKVNLHSNWWNKSQAESQRLGSHSLTQSCQVITDTGFFICTVAICAGLQHKGTIQKKTLLRLGDGGGFGGFPVAFYIGFCGFNPL